MSARPSLFASGTAGMSAHNRRSSRPGDGGPAMTVIPPSLPLRPITTHINLLVVGASRSGKGAFMDTFKDVLGLTPAAPEPPPVYSGCAPDPAQAPHSSSSFDVNQPGGAADAWSAFTAWPAGWRTAYEPLVVAVAGRELVYSVQSAPGWGSTLDPAAWLEALVGLVLGARQKDYVHLGGARGLHKSVVCGALAHSYTAALYFLPPTGPTATDLVLMAALSQSLPLVPVLGACWTAPGGQGDAGAVAELMAEVEQLLAAPGQTVPGLKQGDIQLLTRPAVKPLWLSPLSTTPPAAPSSSSPGANAARPAAAADAEGDTPTPASSHLATRQAPNPLDVISCSSEDDMYFTPQPAACTAKQAAAGSETAGVAKEPAAAGSSNQDGVAAAGLQRLVELLAGQEVYYLLDASWDAYTSFCGDYEGKAAGNMAWLVSAHLERFNPVLLCGPAVKAREEQEKTIKELLIQLNGWLCGRVGSGIMQEARNQNWSPAVKELCRKMLG